jgi:N-acetylglutamate synthase-like GNAT family acetyltransferase
MSYTIKIADINDADVDFEVRNLIRLAYNTTDLLPEKYLAANIRSSSSKQSLFLVALEDNKIIGCNAFIADEFLLDEKVYMGYQSCWTVTHPEYRGRHVFSTIINEAKKILKAQGAGFLYGIANNQSNPIFIQKLGFRETASLVLRIPNVPFIKYFYFTGKLLQHDRVCKINEELVKERKAIQYPSEVKVVKHNDSWLWGKLIRKKKFGLQFPVFYVGGVQLDKEKDLSGLVSAVFKLKPVLFIQFFTSKTNTFNVLLRGWRKPKMNGFIFFNLNMPEFEHLDLMIGPIDIF